MHFIFLRFLFCLLPARHFTVFPATHCLAIFFSRTLPFPQKWFAVFLWATCHRAFSRTHTPLRFTFLTIHTFWSLHHRDTFLGCWTLLPHAFDSICHYARFAVPRLHVAVFSRMPRVFLRVAGCVRCVTCGTDCCLRDFTVTRHFTHRLRYTTAVARLRSLPLFSRHIHVQLPRFICAHFLRTPTPDILPCVRRTAVFPAVPLRFPHFCCILHTISRSQDGSSTSRTYTPPLRVHFVAFGRAAAHTHVPRHAWFAIFISLLGRFLPLRSPLRSAMGLSFRYHLLLDCILPFTLSYAVSCWPFWFTTAAFHLPHGYKILRLRSCILPPRFIFAPAHVVMRFTTHLRVFVTFAGLPLC